MRADSSFCLPHGPGMARPATDRLASTKSCRPTPFEMKTRTSLASCLCTALLCTGLWTAPASAGTVNSSYGADDGLGLGLASGDTVFPLDLFPGTGVAEWGAGGRSVLLGSSWSGTLQSASLSIFSGGWGLDAPAQVFLNNQLVGNLTVADGSATPNGDNQAFRDVFDLGAFLGLMTGSDLFEIRTTNPDDDGALGFLGLTLVTQDAGGNTVPEPDGAALAAVAIVSAWLASRRRRQA